jgi:hypothetical protein
LNNQTHCLQNSNARLEAAFLARDSVPRFDPAPVSPYVAMSLLQKAIRRGEGTLALRAAATLLLEAPEKLWRRCCGIAFEDIGIASPDTISMVVAALQGKRFRAELGGGEWSTASLIVSDMAQATKCRAADDLLMSAELHPDFQVHRKAFAQASSGELVTVAMSDARLQQRALALWYLLGTDRFTARKLIPRRGQPSVAFESLRQAGVHETTIEIAQEGYRRSRSVLPALVALLSLSELGDAASIKDDRIPPQQTICGIPGWAYDLYSREGRKCLELFLLGNSKTAQWVNRRLPLSQRINFLGGLVFRIEGGRCRQRLRWPTADTLRDLVDFECHGLEAFDALEHLRSDIVLLNEVRADVL